MAGIFVFACFSCAPVFPPVSDSVAIRCKQLRVTCDSCEEILAVPALRCFATRDRQPNQLTLCVETARTEWTVRLAIDGPPPVRSSFVHKILSKPPLVLDLLKLGTQAVVLRLHVEQLPLRIE